MVLTQEQKDELCGIVDNEGFAYAFMSYSSFEEYDDEEFHVKRKAFEKAAKDLEKYIGYDEY